MIETRFVVSLPDVANLEDRRQVPIPRVGVRGVQLPVQIASGKNGAFHTVASVDFAVSLQPNKKGTHMSRLMQILDESAQYPLTLDELQRVLDRARNVLDADRAEIDEQVRRAAYVIIEGKGATYYGIGSALARIVESVIEDQRSILTVCAPTEEVAGVRDVTVALPRLVGGDGILATFPQPLNPSEAAALNRSATIVREAISSLGL